MEIKRTKRPIGVLLLPIIVLLAAFIVYDYYTTRLDMVQIIENYQAGTSRVYLEEMK